MEREGGKKGPALLDFASLSVGIHDVSALCKRLEVRVLSMEWPVSDLEVMADLEGF